MNLLFANFKNSQGRYYFPLLSRTWERLCTKKLKDDDIGTAYCISCDIGTITYIRQSLVKFIIILSYAKLKETIFIIRKKWAIVKLLTVVKIITLNVKISQMFFLALLTLIFGFN